MIKCVSKHGTFADSIQFYFRNYEPYIIMNQNGSFNCLFCQEMFMIDLYNETPADVNSTRQGKIRINFRANRNTVSMVFFRCLDCLQLTFTFWFFFSLKKIVYLLNLDFNCLVFKLFRIFALRGKMKLLDEVIQLIALTEYKQKSTRWTSKLWGKKWKQVQLRLDFNIVCLNKLLLNLILNYPRDHYRLTHTQFKCRQILENFKYIYFD